MPAKVATAERALAATGLSAYVDIREGDARTTLRDLGDPVDFALIDGWLGTEPSLARQVVELVAPQLRGGDCVANDWAGAALWSPCPTAPTRRRPDRRHLLRLHPPRLGPRHRLSAHQGRTRRVQPHPGQTPRSPQHHRQLRRSRIHPYRYDCPSAHRSGDSGAQHRSHRPRPDRPGSGHRRRGRLSGLRRCPLDHRREDRCHRRRQPVASLDGALSPTCQTRAFRRRERGTTLRPSPRNRYRRDPTCAQWDPNVAEDAYGDWISVRHRPKDTR